MKILTVQAQVTQFESLKRNVKKTSIPLPEINRILVELFVFYTVYHNKSVYPGIVAGLRL